MAPDALLYRPEEAAELLGIGRNKVFELMAAGHLPSVQIGRSRRISRQTLEHFVSHLESGALSPRRSEAEAVLVVFSGQEANARRMPRPRAITPEHDRSFALSLARARSARSWSVARLSSETADSVSPSAIWKIESAGRKASVGEAVALASALGLGLEEMVFATSFEVTMTAS